MSKQLSRVYLKPNHYSRKTIEETIKLTSDNRRNRVYIIAIGLVWFYGISTIVSYLKPNPLYIYIYIYIYIYKCILNIYDFVWSGFMAYQAL